MEGFAFNLKRACLFGTALIALVACSKGEAPLAPTGTPTAPLVSRTGGPYRIVDLGTIPGASSIEVLQVNSLGQVLVRSATYDWDLNVSYRSFLWIDGVMTDLGTLGGDISYAAALNDKGQVVGWSTRADG